MKSEIDVPIMAEMRRQQQAQEVHLRITFEFGLFALLLGLILFLRVTNLQYNTLFIDEAINAVIGKDLLAGDFGRRATTYHFGSYLYPIVAGIANHVGGVIGLRFVAAITNSMAAVFVFLTARSLFGGSAALFAMFFFGFTASNVNLGQLAVYDSLALPFLAMTLYFLVTAVISPQHEKRYLILAAISLILTVLSKYIGLIYIPALGLTALVLYWTQGRRLWPAMRMLALYFILPAFLLLGAYGLYYLADLLLVATEQGYAWSERSQITIIIIKEMWPVAVPAFLGLIMLVIAVWRSHATTPPIFSRLAATARSTHSRSFFMLTSLLLVLLLLTWLAAPLYHWWGYNIRSLWKNVNYTLIFLAPLAGYAVAAFIEYNRRHGQSARFMGLFIAIVFMFLFINNTLNNNWAFHQSWPNAGGVVHYLRQQGLDQSSRVLAEGANTYEYYLSQDTADRQVWSSMWYMEYGELQGEAAMIQAIQDRYFDFVILEGYYETRMRNLLNPVLVEAGYVVGYQEEQPLRSGGSVLVQVFVTGQE